MNANVTISPNQVAELGMFHAEREAAQDFDAVMETLSADPKYLYPSLGKGFSGRENAERFYRWFFENFSSKVIDGQLIRQWANETSVCQEYDVTLQMEEGTETHRILGVLFVEGDKLGGEIVYASELAIRRMLGPMFEELVVMDQPYGI